MFDAKDYSNHVRREWAITSPRIRMSVISVLAEAGYTPVTDVNYLTRLKEIMEWISGDLDEHCLMIESLDSAEVGIDLSDINIEDDGDEPSTGFYP